MSLMRDPRNNYALVQTDTLAKSYRHLQLDDFLQAQAVTSDAVSLANPALFTELDAMVDKIDPDQWKAYLRFHVGNRSEEHTSELQSLMRISYAVVCLKKKTQYT